jgi:DNA processing protein
MTIGTTTSPTGTTGTETDLLARVALNQLCEPGDAKVADLVAELGATRLHALLLEERELDGLHTDVALRLAAVDPVRVLEQAARTGLRFVVPGDPEWPAQVESLHGAGALHERGGTPIGLWVRGPLRLDQVDSSVAIVGSRDATTYGDELAREIAATAGEQGCVVVSGAAIGIDRSAHRGAVSAGAPTVAVLACGADRVYPEENGPMIEHIARRGAVVSEAPPGGAPFRIRFLSRNRIIAALSRGTVVVEAARRSGSLNTANWASMMHRPVMGVPGPVTSMMSGGVHEWIRRGAMSLVTCGADVLEVVSPAGEQTRAPARGDDRARDKLKPREKQVLDAVPAATPAPSDSIARTAGIGLREVRGVLGRLAEGGFVDQGPTGWRLTALGHR